MIQKNIYNEENIQQENNIFSSQCLNDYFIFSLDSLKIYYANSNVYNNTPNFKVFYDNNKQSFYGKEIPNNNNQDSCINPLGQLSGKKEFNIQYFELYELKFN